MGKMIGIDLGTTNSCVAALERGNVIVIPNSEGGRTTPSIVAFNKRGERLVGQTAKNQAVTNADRTVQSIKRYMGTNHRVTIDEKTYTPQEISAMILQKIKIDAEAYLGEEVTDAVITVPAYFTDAQRQATKDSGKIVGLNVRRIMNEPTAAALAYGIDNQSEKHFMVYDLGGGTFDVSILEINEGIVEVLATAGNNRLGGDDFDQRIINWILDQFYEENRIDLRDDRMAMQRIRESAEKAKIELSSALSAVISQPYITADEEGAKHLELTLTRTMFNELTQDLVQETMKSVKQALKDANIKVEDIGKIVLVGGSTRIPAVQEAVKRVTGKEAFKGINPDECVAMGAAIQGGILEGDVTDLLLLDVVPLSLSIETLGGICTKLIERNTTIPTRKKQIFSTASDNQSIVNIHVLQGEREMAADNKTLGRFSLTGITPARRGVPKIEVTFYIDANGIVSVSAKDMGTGRMQAITINASPNLSDQEIKKAIQEAKQYENKDKERRKIVQARNQAEWLIAHCKKILKDDASSISVEQKDVIENIVCKLTDILNMNDADKIADYTLSFSQIIQNISQDIFKKSITDP